MITANQLRAARALLNIDQRQMADLADLSVPTIQRMEASDGVIRANVDSLMKLVSALENAGIELINPGLRVRRGPRRPAPGACREPEDQERPATEAVFFARHGADAINIRDIARIHPRSSQGVTLPLSTRSSSASRPCSIAIGVGGQPGMWRSTGITSPTPPTTA